MRSGFLNACPPSEASISSSSEVLEKVIRNKRKFKTDHMHGTAPQTRDGGPEDVTNDCCNSSITSSSCSINSADVSSNIPDGVHCSSVGPCSIPHSRMTRELEISNMPSLSATSDVLASEFCHQCCKEDIKYAIIQEPDWDKSSESQLEAILINMLDALYQEAVSKLISLGYCQKDASNAVLKNGRWNGKDAISSVVESSLTWLQNGEATQGLLNFTNLKDMEIHVLAEMVCLLRKVHPILSKGDAMWCLLICEMNLLLACTMDDDVGLQSSTSLNLNATSSSTMRDAINNAVPLPQQTPHLSPAVVGLTGGSSCKQPPLGGLGNLSSDNRSAFSAPSFSTSPVGKVAVASRQSNIGMSLFTSSSAQFSPARCRNSRNSARDMKAEALNSSAAVKRGVSNQQKDELETCTYASCDEAWTNNPCLCADSLKMNVNPADMCALLRREKHMLKIFRNHSVAQTFETVDDTAFGKREIPANPGSDVSHTKGGNNRIPDLEGKNADCQTYRVAKDVACNLSNVPRPSCFADNENKLVGKTNLCLPKDPITFPELISSNSQVSNSNDASASFTPCPASFGEILQCNDLVGEQRKTEMLVHLIDRVKFLESQLQGWSEWAQQKVMQAAQRLRKDSLELKALRLERDECGCLKKDKQNLEESSMKKSLEMENALRKALSQVDRANATARRLKAENAEVRAEMDAAKMTAAEYVSACQEVSEKENKSVKKGQVRDRQKTKLQDELTEGKRHLTTVLFQLSQAKERKQQAEAKWRQEKKTKAEALSLAELEKRAKEQIEVACKRQEEALQSKTEGSLKYHCEEVKKLQSEISQLKAFLGLQPALTWSYSSRPGVSHSCSVETYKQINAQLLAEIMSLRNSHKEIQLDRRCLMCKRKEISIVFLPCAHQALCIKCNELHFNGGFKNCSACKTPIEQRIRVYGVNST